MFGSMRSVFVLVLAGGLTWSCSDERVMTPQVTQTGEQIGGPLSKPAVRRDVTQAVVVVTVQQDGAPVSGATVELSRSVSGTGSVIMRGRAQPMRMVKRRCILGRIT